MHRSHVGIQEWFWAAYLVATHPPGFSAKQFERQIECAYRTAWFMLHHFILKDTGKMPVSPSNITRPVFQRAAALVRPIR